MNNSVYVEFAGQAGFIIETQTGYRVGIDLYLSDCCERYFGFKRLMPYLYDPMGLDLDLLISTHAHYDHFDPDSVPLIMSNNKTQLVAACDVKAEAERLNLDSKRITYLKEGESFKNSDVCVKAVPCDHGKDTPDAIGLLIEIDSKRIYITGDTCYREDNFKNSEFENLDLLIMPINGAYGNLNEAEGAATAGLIKPKLCIPCHFWNFAQHGGNPQLFIEEMQAKYPDIKYNLMRPGETVKI